MAILDRVAARISRDRAVEAIDSTFAPQQTAVLGNSVGNGLTRVGGMLSLGVAATAEGPTTLVNIGRPAAAIWQPGTVASVTGSISNPFASGSPGTSVTQPVSGGLVAHDIAGDYHTGVLVDEQGPQFLLVNGSRNLAGNLQVDPGVTIDGVDISVHAADIDAHHFKVHAYDSADHTGTLSWANVNKSGSNLSDLTNKPHSQLTNIGANDHHNQIHSITGTDHTLSAAKFALVGASALNTLGLLTPLASSVGPVETILKSDSAGGLELVKLRTQTIDTNTGQNLTVQPNQNLILAPATNIVVLNDGKAIQSSGWTASGFAGAGFRIDQGISAANTTTAEFDHLWVRGTMHVYELVIQQIRATNGSIFVTSSAKIATVTLVSGSTYDLTVDASTNDYQPFAVNDVIRAQRVNLGTTNLVYRSDLLVTNINVGGDAKKFRATVQGGTTIPAVGMEFVRLGNTNDITRQGVIYLTADDNGAPFIDVVNGITAHSDWNTTGKVKVRLGRLDGITANANEYGLWAGTGTGDTQQALVASNRGVLLTNIPLNFKAGTGATVMALSPGTNNAAPYIALGSPLPTTPVDNSGLWLGREEATTNLIANPSFEYDTPGATITGWTAYTSTSGVAPTGTRAVVNTQQRFGTQALELIKTGGSALSRWGIYDSFNVTNGIEYTFSVYLKVTAIAGGTKQVALYASVAGATTIVRQTDVCDWTRLTVTVTAPASGTGILYFWIDNADTATVYIDGAQVEEKAYATPYCDGSLGMQHSWAGTTHNSASTRTEGYRFRLGNISNGALANGIYWDGSALQVKGAITIQAGSSGIGTFSDANIDNIADGSTYKRTNANEKTGAGRAYTALDANNILTTRVDPGTIWGANPGAGVAGLLLGSDYMGYWTGTAWKSYMDNLGKFYLNSGASDNYLAWNGTTLTVSGAINIVGASSGYANLSDKPASLSAINAAEANALTTSAANVFVDSFDGLSPYAQYERHQGTETPIVASVADSYSGGYILRIGDNSGNDEVRISHKRLIPFDPNKTYRTTVRMRRTAGAGTVYVGLLGVAADGVTLVNITGANSYGSAHYHTANNSAPGATWTEFTGYTKGFGATNGTTGATTPSAPGQMHPNVRYIRPFIIANYNSVAGTIEIDAITVDVMDGSWYSAAGMPARFGDAIPPTGTGLQITATHMGYYDTNTWKTFIKSDGKFFFAGEAANTVGWDGTDLYGSNANVKQWYARASNGKLYTGAGNVVLSAQGIDITGYDATTSNPIPTENVRAVTWWNDADNYNPATDKPRARMWGGHDNNKSVWQVDVDPGDLAAPMSIWMYDKQFWFSGFTTIAGVPGMTIATSNITTSAPLYVQGGFSSTVDLLPSTDITYNLGSALKRWNSIYANNLVISGSISGQVLSGAEWEYAGDMVIDANSASTTTVSIVNQGAGTANLSVENNIIVGGTVDGVDVSSFKSSYDTHIGQANAHHNQSHVLATTGGLGADHTVSGLTSGQVLRATGTTTAAFGGIQDSDLPATIVRTSRTITAGAGLTGTGDLSADRTFAVGAGTMITVNADDVQITAGANYQFIGTGSGTAAGWRNVSELAGSGLTAATGILAVGAGTLMTVAADTIGLSNGTAQYQFPMTGATTFTPTWTDLSTLAGSGLTFATGAFAVGAGTLMTVAADTIGLSNGTAQYQIPTTGATPFTPTWTDLSTFAGAGLTFGTGTFAVGAGTMITINADDVQISAGSNYQFIGTGSGTAAGWRNVSELAGSGLTAATGILAVGAGTLMTVAADTIGLSNGTAQYQFPMTGPTTFTPAWTDLSTLAGSGLTFATGTFAVGAGTMMTVAADTIGLSNGTAQYLVPVTGATPFTPAWTNLSDFAGAGLTFGTGTFAVGAGTMITVNANDVQVSAGSNYQFIGTGSGTAAGWRNVSELAGSGLTAATGILAVGAGTLMTVAADTIGLSNGTAQYQFPMTGPTTFTPTWTDLSTLAGSGLTFATGAFAIGAGTLMTVAADTIGLSNGTAQYQIPVTGATPFTPTWTDLSTFAGAGIGFSAGTFNITAGDLISVTADAVGLSAGGNYQFIGTGSGTTAGWRNVSELAGSGLTAATGILAVGAGTMITVGADTVGLSNGTAQYQFPMTGATPFTPTWTDLSTLAGAGLTFATGALAVGAGTLMTVAADTIGLSNGTAQYQIPTTGATPFTPTWTDLSTFAGAGIGFSSGTFIINAGTLISTTGDAVGLTNGTAQYQFPMTGATTYTPTWTDLSTLAGAGLTFGTGTFAVGAGTMITVNANDVQVSAGANYQFIGTGAGTAAGWRNVSELAGSGLTAATGILAVGAGAGITINADDVALTTPGTLTVSSTNSATGSHTHAITTTNNATAASILASDASGTLQLAKLGLGMAHGGYSLSAATGIHISRTAAEPYILFSMDSIATAQIRSHADGVKITDEGGTTTTLYTNVTTQRVGIKTNTPDVTLDVAGDVQVGGFGHFKGWSADSSVTGLGVDIGISSSEGYLMAYDRTALQYYPLNIKAGASRQIYLDTTGFTGFGTTSPEAKITTASDSSAELVHLEFYNTSSTGAITRYRKARGTEAAPTVVTQNDHLMALVGQGWSAAAATWRNAGAIYITVDGEPDTAALTTDMPGRITFWTTPDGTSTVAERMRIDNVGNVGIGTAAAATKLHISDVIGTTLRIASTRNDSTWLDEDVIGAIEFYSHDASSLGAGVKASIKAIQTGASATGGFAGLAFSTTTTSGANDTERMRIDHVGRVSINATSAAGYQFYVAGTAKFTGSVDTDVQFLGQAADTVSAPSFAWTGDTNTGLYQPAADTIGFVTGGTERMRLDAAGNIGIATSDIEAWSTTYRAVEFGAYSAFMFSPTWSTGYGNFLTYNLYYDGTWKYKNTNPATYYRQGSLGHWWGIAPSGTIDNTATVTSAMKLDITGNLGIGGDPNYKLDVYGDIRTSGNIYVDGGMVDFGTNTITESTTLQFTGSKEIEFLQKIKATSWSMSTAGALAAASFAFTGGGSMGSDLTIGANVLFVNVAGSRVGINRAPDAQFDLDVAGPIRGTYLVGKHAIQLPSAVGVWHFDGPEPSTLNFNGTLNSHAGSAATITGPTVYRPGRYGKAIQLAEATTNLVTNPSFEASPTPIYPAAGTTTITGYGLYGTGALVTRAEDGYYGTYCLRLASGTANDPYLYQSYGTGLATGQTYTYSLYIKAGTDNAIGKTITLNLRENQDAGYLTSTNFTVTATWQRIQITRTLTHATPTALNYWFVFRSTANDNSALLVDGTQLEQKGHATSYCDGSLPDHTWAGTAHASTSSRAVASLTVPNAISRNAYTVMGWFKPCRSENNSLTSAWRPRFFQVGAYNGAASMTLGTYSTNQSIYYYLRNTVDGAWTSYGAAADLNYNANEWIFLAVSWDGDKHRFYAAKPSVADSMIIYEDSSRPGLYGTGANQDLVINQSSSGLDLLDELVILDYAAETDLIRSIYESDAPVFVESSVFHWRAPGKANIWVDEFGLWASSVTGDHVLGLYTGDPNGVATFKTWGGINIEDNDVLIGRNTAGYMHWDDSAQQLYIQGDITATTGHIGGWAIGTTTLSSYDTSPKIVLTRGDTNVGNILAGTGATAGGINAAGAGTDIVFWAGSTHANRATAPFRVYANGDIYASNADITADITATTGTIGGWTINSTTIVGGSVTLNSTGIITAGSGNDLATISASDATYRLWIGHATAASAPFRVTKAGAVTATSGVIGGWTLAATSLTSGSGVTKVGVDSSGTSYAFYAGSDTPASAPFRVTPGGSLTATSGDIGGWTIGATTISSNNVTLNEAGSISAGTTNDIIIISATDATYRLWIGNATAASANFSVTKAGNIWAEAGTIAGWTLALNSLTSGSAGTTVGIDSGGTNPAFYAGSATPASAPFRVTQAGALTATSGLIAGWTLAANSLTSGTGATTVGIDSGGTNPAFYAGSATPASAPFRVTNAGALTATSGTVGGWTLATTTLTGTNVTLTNTGIITAGTGTDMVTISAADATYRLWVGHGTAASAPFRVTKAGAVTATSGLIAGWTLALNSLTSGSGATTVGIDSGGTNPAFYAGSATPASAPFRVTQAGALTATSGLIAGWTLAANLLSSGSGVTKVGIDSGSGTGIAFWAGSDTAGSAPFRVTPGGALTATSGSIAGWTLAANLLSSGSGVTKVSIDSGSGTGFAFWAGSDTAGSAPFRVTPGGALTATSGSVGGWTMAATTLTGTNVTLTNTGVITAGTGTDMVTISAVDATYRLWVGHGTAASANFSVTKAGNIFAKAGSIAGWTLATNSLTSGSTGTTVGIDSGGTNPAFYAGSATPATAPFRVTNVGFLYANNADISGTITADDGSIGSWVITATTIANSTSRITLTHGGTNAARIEGGDLTSSNIAGLNSPNAATDVAFWSGSNHAGRATAPFRVLADGTIFASKAQLTGGLITGSGLGITVNAVWGCHFDGPDIGNLINPNAFNGRPASASGAAIGVPGKFGKAMQFAPATTNLVENPSFEVNTTGYAAYNAVAGVTLSQDGTYCEYGLYSLKAVCTGAATNQGWQYNIPSTVTASASYSAGVWLKSGTGATVTLALINQANSTAFATTSIVLTNTWTWYTLTGTTPVGCTSIRIAVYQPAAAALTFYTDGVQVEAGGFASPFCDGSLGPGHTWTGTEHASTSSRTGQNYLTYGAARAYVPETIGSVAVWFYPIKRTGAGGSYQTIIRHSGASGNLILRVSDANDLLYGYWGATNSGTSNTVNYNAWNHAAMTVNGATKILYLNGVKTATTTGTAFAVHSSNGLVLSSSTATEQFMGFIDDIFIVPYAMSDAEVDQLYQTQLPVNFPASNSEIRLMGTSSPAYITASNSGIFGMDDIGNETFAISNSSAVSWGGKTINAGDIVIGDPSARNLFYNNTAGELSVGLTTAEHVLITGTSLAFKNSTTTYASLTDGVLVLGKVADLESRVEISSGAIYFKHQATGGAVTNKITLLANGTANFTGIITAEAGGTIGGFAIGANALTAGSGGTAIGIDTGLTNPAFWAGSTTGTAAPFRVTNAGALHAETGDIAGWDLVTTTISKNSLTLNSTGVITAGTSNDLITISAADATYRLWIGHATATSAPFSVDKDGVMTSTAGNIGGWTITASALKVDNGTNDLMIMAPSNNPYLSIGNPAPINAVSRNGVWASSEEATTNLIANPSFEYDAPGTTHTGWTAYSYNAGVAPTGTRTIVTSQALFGTKSIELVKTGGSTGSRWGIYDPVAVTTGITYTLSAWIKITAIVGGTQRVAIYAAAGAATSTVLTGPCDWTRISTTVTSTTTGTGNFYIWIDNADTATVYVDGVQLEALAYATPYTDGSLSNATVWNGTAHNGTSTRTAGPRFRVGTVDGTTLTAGLLWDGTKLTWKAANTSIDASGNLTAASATLTTATVTGVINATTGYIGGPTNAWTIAASKLSSTNIALHSSGTAATARLEVGDGTTANLTGGVSAPSVTGDVVFWAGSTHANRAASSKFRVTAGGAMYAGDNANAYINWDGTKLTWKAANTSIDASGNLTAASATLQSGTIAGTLTVSGSGNINVTGTGKITTANADIDADGFLVRTGSAWNSGDGYRFNTGTTTYAGSWATFINATDCELRFMLNRRPDEAPVKLDRNAYVVISPYAAGTRLAKMWLNTTYIDGTGVTLKSSQIISIARSTGSSISIIADTIDINGNTPWDNGNLTPVHLNNASQVSTDADYAYTLGKQRIGNVFTGSATFTHRSYTTSANYAFSQNSSGSTFMNAATNSYLSIGGTVVTTISSSLLTLASGVGLTLVSGTITLTSGNVTLTSGNVTVTAGNINVQGASNYYQRAGVTGYLFFPMTGTTMTDTLGNVWNGSLTLTTQAYSFNATTNGCNVNAKAVIISFGCSFGSPGAAVYIAAVDRAAATNPLVIRPSMANQVMSGTVVVRLDSSKLFDITISGGTPNNCNCKILGYFM